jgi:hypothetical protein
MCFFLLEFNWLNCAQKSNSLRFLHDLFEFEASPVILEQNAATGKEKWVRLLNLLQPGTPPHSLWASVLKYLSQL